MSIGLSRGWGFQVEVVYGFGLPFVWWGGEEPPLTLILSDFDLRYTVTTGRLRESETLVCTVEPRTRPWTAVVFERRYVGSSSWALIRFL